MLNKEVRMEVTLELQSPQHVSERWFDGSGQIYEIDASFNADELISSSQVQALIDIDMLNASDISVLNLTEIGEGLLLHYGLTELNASSQRRQLQDCECDCGHCDLIFGGAMTTCWATFHRRMAICAKSARIPFIGPVAATTCVAYAVTSQLVCVAAAARALSNCKELCQFRCDAACEEEDDDDCPPNQCCGPQCEEGGSGFFGDVHIITFDGPSYDCQVHSPVKLASRAAVQVRGEVWYMKDAGPKFFQLQVRCTLLLV